jgi:hypothetical protein
MVISTTTHEWAASLNNDAQKDFGSIQENKRKSRSSDKQIFVPVQLQPLFYHNAPLQFNPLAFFKIYPSACCGRR